MKGKTYKLAFHMTYGKGVLGAQTAWKIKNSHDSLWHSLGVKIALKLHLLLALHIIKKH